MDAIVISFDSQEKAIEAIRRLREAGYAMDKVLLVAKRKGIKVKTGILSTLTLRIINISIMIGSTLGLLTGLGLFPIPGFNFLYRSGLLYGGFAGFEGGIMAGAIIAVFTSIGMDIFGIRKNEQYPDAERFELTIQGNDQEISLARHVLREDGDRSYLSIRK
jgi:hypothetical protein